MDKFCCPLQCRQRGRDRQLVSRFNSRYYLRWFNWRLSTTGWI